MHLIWTDRPAVTPSRRTRFSELLRLCARIGYSPHGFPGHVIASPI
ncbi:MAG: capsid protein [Rhizobiales bacterium]|nr:capsid protein [Hyphomicrobiales bacterium]